MTRKTINSNPLNQITAGKTKVVLPAKANASKSKRNVITSNKTLTEPSSGGGKLTKIGAKKMDHSKLPHEKLAAEILEEDVPNAKEDLAANTSPEEASNLDYRHVLAKTTVKNYSMWATAAGLIPVTFLDTATIAGVQLKMIHELCDIYKVPFKREAALAIITSITAGGVTTFAAGKLVDLGIKNIPVVGNILSIATQPAISFGTTFGLGQIFIQHFEESGTLLNIDLADAKANFKKQYTQAKADYLNQLGKAKSWFSKEAKVIDAEVSEVTA